MNAKKLFFIFCLTLFIIFNLLSQDKQEINTQKEKSIKPTSKGILSTGKKRALIIGISDYEKNPKLSFAHTDAINYKDFLISKSGGVLNSDDIVMLINEQATDLEFTGAMDWLINETKEGDLAIIYFSGHGDIESKYTKNRGFLLCSNTPNTNYITRAISLIYLQDQLEILAQKKADVLLIVDACHSGKLSGGDEGLEITAKGLQSLTVNKILSCRPGEKSLEDTRWGGGAGAFTYNLLNGLKGLADLNGDGFVTFSELEIYLRDNVSKQTDDAQHPFVDYKNAKDIISVVDPATLSELKNSNKIFAENNIKTSKGIYDNINLDIDSNIVFQFDAFKNFIVEKKIIEPEEDCAYSIYKSLADNESAKTIFNRMKGMLVIALQEQGQNIISLYLEGKEIADSLSVSSAVAQLDKSIELMGESHPNYKIVKSRKLFLEAASLRNSREYKAVECLNESIMLEPEAAFVYNEIGSIYMKNEKYKDAEKNFKKASEISPKWIYPLMNLGILYRDYVYDDSLSGIYFNKVIELQPENSQAYFNLGLLFYSDKSIKNYQKAIMLDTNFKDAYYKLGMRYYYNQDYAKAIVNFSKVIELDSEYVGTTSGRELILRDKYIKEMEKQKSSTEKKEIDNIYFYRAFAYCELEEYKKAINDYNIVILNFPNYAIAYFNRGLSYSGIKEHLISINDFTRAIEIDSNDVLSYNNRAWEYIDIKEYKKALTDLEKAYKLNKENLLVQGNIAYVFSLTGDYKKAILFSTKVIENKNHNFGGGVSDNTCLSYVYKSRALSYSKLNKYDEAFKDYKRAYELDSNNEYLYKNLGITYYDLKEYQNAIANWEKAITLNPDFKEDLMPLIEDAKNKIK